jgi:hypothetical protein
MGTEDRIWLASHPRVESSATPLVTAFISLGTPDSRKIISGLSIRRIFSFPVVLAVFLLGGVFLIERSLRLDPDTWWHIKAGEQILATLTWPTSDPYSFTARGNDWMAYEWLGEVLMALFMRLGGMRGLDLLLITLTGFIVLLIYYYAYLRCTNWKAAFVASVLVLPLAALCFTLRPQLLGFVFLLVTLIALERFRQGRERALCALPVVFLLWVNSHGSFALGLAVMGLYWVSGLFGFQAGELDAVRWTRGQRHRLAIVSLFCVLVLPITPYGTRLAAYPLEMALLQPVNVGNIQEWQPLLIFDWWQNKLFLALLLLVILAQVVLRPKHRLETLALILFTIYAASVHGRFIVILAIVLAPLLATLVARWFPPYDSAKDLPYLNAVLIIAVITGMIMFLPSRKELHEGIEKKFPVAAAEYLRRHPVRGPMFNDYGWGGFLIWSLGPHQKVFIDGRADIYEYAGALEDYLSIAKVQRNSSFLLRKYHVDACLIESRSSLATLLAASSDWEQAYMDDVAVLYVRKDPGRSLP